MDTERAKYNLGGDIEIEAIQKEYSRIDCDWLRLHYKTTVGLMVFAWLVEIAICITLMHSDLLSVPIHIFWLKYMVVPSGLNLILIAVDTAIVRSARLSQTQKTYAVSHTFVGICFVLFTVHSIFVVTYYIFAIGIMLTTIYASYRLTAVTALTSMGSIVISELFILWDPGKGNVFEDTLRRSNFLCALSILGAFSAVCMISIRFEKRKNEASIQIEIERRRLQQTLQVDELTGIFNRKALHAALKDMEEDAGGGRYILAVADIDYFKQVNDSLGHHHGDRCLLEFAEILKNNSENAAAFRYGGDEFCLLFYNTDMARAAACCEQVSLKLRGWRFQEKPELKMTVSFGLAEYYPQIDGVRLFVHADHALYRAKEARNSVCVY